MQVTIKNNQSIWDISLIYSGSFESAWEIASQNKISITDSPPENRPLLVPEEKDKKVIEFLSIHSASPATDFNQINIFDKTFDNTFIW